MTVRTAQPTALVTKPLWRNRDFVVLLTGELLSTGGTAVSSIAYPLLVLAVTHSPAKAGIVGFARLAPIGLFALVAGLAADRWNRKRLMVAAEAARAVIVGTLALLIVADRVAYWQIAVAAFVDGAAWTFSSACQSGAVRAVVPKPQVPAAIGAQRARMAVVRLAGPPLGGLLFGIGRAVPFLVDAVSYVFSIASLLAIRQPFQGERERDSAPIRSQLADGFEFIWTHPFLRTTALLYGVGNVTIPAALFLIVVVGRRQGLAAAEIGLLLAAFGACALLGALVSPLFRRALSVRAIMLLEFWTGLGTAAFLVWPSAYVLAASVLPQAVSLPVTDSVVEGYRVAITPDRLLGRVESVRTNISLLAAPLGPLLAGLLLGSFSARTTVACFFAGTLALAIWGTLSPAIKDAPRLGDLDEAYT